MWEIYAYQNAESLFDVAFLGSATNTVGRTLTGPFETTPKSSRASGPCRANVSARRTRLDDGSVRQVAS
jgi:hypothetical protein